MIFTKLSKIFTTLIVCAISTFADTISINLQLATAARERLSHTVRYDGSYRGIGYPMGDVPDSIGVCTDVVIRSYRGVGIDLQQLVHEDMKENFSKYPIIWGASRPDKNIDHRRVPNLQRFFSRYGTSLPVSKESLDYKIGDLVTWMLPGNLPHIGVVVAENPVLIVHNIGSGPELEDMPLWYPITGHYRYFPTK